MDLSLHAPQPKLIPRSDRVIASEINLEHLLALHFGAFLILQTYNNFTSFDVNHIARRRVGVPSIDAKRDPARLIADWDGLNLFRRQYGRIENVYTAVGRIREP